MLNIFEKINFENPLSKLDSFEFRKFNLAQIDPQFLKLVLLVLAVFLITSLIDFFLSRSFIGKKYRIFVGPGVIVHELSHAIMCLLTGAKIKKISLFDKDGGRVEHYPSVVPVIGPILIAFAPIMFGGVAIYFLSKQIGLNEISFNLLSFDKSQLTMIAQNFLKILHFSSAQSWIIFYLIVSVITTMTPSFQDLRNSAFSMIIIAILIAIVSMFINYHTFFAGAWVINFAAILTSVLALLLLCLVLSIIVYVLSKLFKLS